MTLAADPQTDLALAAPSAPHPTGPQADTHRRAELILWLVPVLLLGLALAVKTWGLVALTLAALPLVPVMFVLFIAISLP